MANENKFYKTSDLPLATFISLYYSIQSIEKSLDSPKRYFLFEQNDELNNLIVLFWSGKAVVDPQKYFNALRLVKARLYSEN